MSKRYHVEQDSPDGGKSTYPECFGYGSKRGRMLSEHDQLTNAIIDCSANAHHGMPDSCTWIWDNLRGNYVPANGIKAAGGRVTNRYPA